MRNVLNINVGILGHVDSGKTSLVAALSTTLSTAALDKSPQSKERGITLDLGFSSFTGEVPEHLQHLNYSGLQITLVDCPGHASLIRTVIGGVQIIDLMLLVIDVTKGMQAQTAECLVVGEVTTPKCIIALNKVDLFPEAERSKLVKKASKRLATSLGMTKFAGAPMVPVIAKPGSGSPPWGIDELRRAILSIAQPKPRPESSPFLFAIDHCFQLKGQGTVMTGTVLQGSIKVNEVLELPDLKVERPVKSIQVFHQPVSSAAAGDRAGLCVRDLDPRTLERGYATAPGSLTSISAAVALVDKIRFYSGKVPSKAKFHVIIGHTSVMAEATFFGLPDGQGLPPQAALKAAFESMNRIALNQVPLDFNFDREYLYQTELYGLEGRPAVGAGSATPHHGPQWVLLRFEHTVTCPPGALFIGAKLDADVSCESCRLAFYGRLGTTMQACDPKAMSRLRVYKVKERQGVIARISPNLDSALVTSLFKKETDISVFVGLKVVTGRGEGGTLEASFGLSGKVRVSFPGGLTPTEGRVAGDNVVHLKCKRFIFDLNKKNLMQ